MTFVALLIPDWPTGAAANDLLAQLLAVAPRAAVTPAKGVAWLDARGLDPAALVERACDALREIGVTAVRAGASRVPIVAEIAAHTRTTVAGEFVTAIAAHTRTTVAGGGVPVATAVTDDTPSPSTAVLAHATGGAAGPIGRALVAAVATSAAEGPAAPPPTTPPLTQIHDARTYLAQLPLDVLQPQARLMSLFMGVGLVTCGDLARLTRESVEVRFGREGLALWKLARADDPRPIFSARPRELPTASLDWTEFSTTDLEQLIFVLHSLLKTVCDQLAVTGIGARTLELTLLLENRRTITQLVTAARSTSQRTTWLRLVRRALEKIELPDRVTGIAVRVDAAGPPTVRQGDFFDFGFASAQAAESAVSHILDLQGDAVVLPNTTAHPLVERRVKWVADETAMVRETARTPYAGTALGFTAHNAQLSLLLLPIAREVEVNTRTRRGFAVPARYVDNGAAHPLAECLGPHCISGLSWQEPVAREYHQGVRADGNVVLLYRDALADRWFLAGWWD